ncbi:hypothetical protein ACIQC9_06150 [Brevundimonas sp. NPDC092305]|uniref:hypothetical protein n=1 Tax=Brevundimonas sp. NPDC092305 TaxID=3363957 RepID=UPI003828549B
MPAVLAGGVATVAVAVVTSLALSGHAPVRAASGQALQIAFFQPPEREITPGSVMDVGSVVDGYEHRPPPPPSPPYAETAWLYEEAPADPHLIAAPARPEDVASITIYTAASQNSGGDRLAFGFDAPRPDYGEARRRREAEREQRMAERRVAEDAGYSGAGPRPDFRREDAFY